MRKIINKILKIVKKNYDTYLQFYIYIKLKYHKIDLNFSTAQNFYGIPYIENDGVFKIGKIWRINSRYSENPIGGNNYCSFVVRKGGYLSIGDGTGISNSAIYCSQRIDIGKNVFIGGDCKIYDTDFHSIRLKNRLNDKNDDGLTKPVVIGDGVFIGTGTIILKGVCVGSEAVIGAGSVVTKNIPPLEIWAGNPAKFIKKIGLN